MAFPLSHTFRTRNIYVCLLFLSTTAPSLMSCCCYVWRTDHQGNGPLLFWRTDIANETYELNSEWRTEQNIRTRLSGVPLSHSSRGIYMYIFFSFRLPHPLYVLSLFCMANWTKRTDRLRSAAGSGAPSWWNASLANWTKRTDHMKGVYVQHSDSP